MSENGRWRRGQGVSNGTTEAREDVSIFTAGHHALSCQSILMTLPAAGRFEL